MNFPEIIESGDKIHYFYFLDLEKIGSADP